MCFHQKTLDGRSLIVRDKSPAITSCLTTPARRFELLPLSFPVHRLGVRRGQREVTWVCENKGGSLFFLPGLKCMSYIFVCNDISLCNRIWPLLTYRRSVYYFHYRGLCRFIKRKCYFCTDIISIQVIATKRRNRASNQGRQMITQVAHTPTVQQEHLHIWTITQKWVHPKCCR